MAKLLVVESRVKEFAKKLDPLVRNVSSDFPSELSKKVEQLIREAIKRAKLNNRKTVQASDV